MSVQDTIAQMITEDETATEAGLVGVAIIENASGFEVLLDPTIFEDDAVDNLNDKFDGEKDGFWAAASWMSE